uniref:Uncharacterized protein n=1 Tax=Fundulus heteroclitus TaxID=8078 RepID=A0A3Q2Q436_FUNHE
MEKTWITTKLANLIAEFQPDSTLAAVQRATNATITMVSMGPIFGMLTCLSAQVLCVTIYIYIFFFFFLGGGGGFMLTGRGPRVEDPGSRTKTSVHGLRYPLRYQRAPLC